MIREELAPRYSPRCIPVDNSGVSDRGHARSPEWGTACRPGTRTLAESGGPTKWESGQAGGDGVEGLAEGLAQAHGLVGQPMLIGRQRDPEHGPGDGLRDQIFG